MSLNIYPLKGGCGADPDRIIKVNFSRNGLYIFEFQELISAFSGNSKKLYCVGGWVAIFFPSNYLHFQVCEQAECANSKDGIKNSLR